MHTILKGPCHVEHYSQEVQARSHLDFLAAFYWCNHSFKLWKNPGIGHSLQSVYHYSLVSQLLHIANVLSIGFSMKTYFCRVETVTFQDSLNYQAGNTETYQSEPLKCLSNTTSPHTQKNWGEKRQVSNIESRRLSCMPVSKTVLQNLLIIFE